MLLKPIVLILDTLKRVTLSASVVSDVCSWSKFVFPVVLASPDTVSRMADLLELSIFEHTTLSPRNMLDR